MPSRAPPLTLQLVRSMSAFELEQGNHEMSTLLILAFHCLLRTGEALQLIPEDFALGDHSGICALKFTKSGKRNSASEAISILDPVVLESVRSLLIMRHQQNLSTLPLWSGSKSALRTRFKKLCQLFGVEHHQFRPYSLRRGGATHWFQCSKSMESTLIRGRWESSRVAKIYISDGLSYLPSIKATEMTSSMLYKYFYISPQTG